MSWIKRLLGLEKEDKPAETVEAPQNNEGERRVIEEACALCHQPIGQERWKKTQGFYIHKRCYKKQQKGIFNGQR